MSVNNVEFRNLGLVDYKTAWDYQENLFEQIVSVKEENKKRKTKLKTPDYLLFCEHPHVYTIGKSGKQSNLLIDEKALKNRGASLFKINRGGDITYHGPGQLVGYPILNLDNFSLSIKNYIYKLEEAIICSLNKFGINSTRVDGATGVWLDAEHPLKARKIGAIGVRISQLVSMHGFALNVNTDLNYFKNIIPCGIQGKSVTSLQNELGRQIEMNEVHNIVLKEFEKIYNMNITKTEVLNP